ncbi:MAG: hypothetical protein PUP93_06035 [Rhizonema sp. NSF051]|nr:hypothetical protein [Rhizonema sp. NSF051]
MEDYLIGISCACLLLVLKLELLVTGNGEELITQLAIPNLNKTAEKLETLC